VKLCALYIFTSYGIPILSEFYQSAEEVINEGLISAFISAVQDFGREMAYNTRSEIETIDFKELTLHLKKMDQATLALVTRDDTDDFNEQSMKPNKVLNKIGMTFLHEYGEVIQNWKGDIGKFEGLKEKVRKIIQKEFNIDSSKYITPSKALTTLGLVKIPKEIKPTALAITALKNATAEMIANESEQTLKKTEQDLEELVKLGYIGVKDIDGVEYFFY
jgi:hypothetical protein